MPEKPLISFVIPVYKKKPHVFKKCLDSLFDMSYKDIEVICVFDGKDVPLEEIASKYEVQSLVIEHGGACKARNAGAELAKGDLISFWDADCYAKPEMAKMWVVTFQDNPEVDFVYSGYEFVSGGGILSRPFDPYALTCGNYIASMFPIKREKAPKWDESLKAAQDWDFWLAAVENGCKGQFIEGFGFTTEDPDADSISGKHWTDDQYQITKRTVTEKHGIPVRDICVTSAMHKDRGVRIAKMLGADFLESASFKPHNYKMVINIGAGMEMRFHNSKPDCIKVQYWMPWDIDAVERLPYSTAVTTIRNTIKEATANWCNDEKSQKRLADLGLVPGEGIKSEVVPLPVDIEGALNELPATFKVLCDIDDRYMDVLKTLRQDLPYIEIDRLEGVKSIEDYSLFVSLKPFPTVDEHIARALINGRHVISNVAAPYTGFIDLDQEVEPFKDELLTRIREARALPWNEKGATFYREHANFSRFKEKVDALIPKPVLEVVA